MLDVRPLTPLRFIRVILFFLIAGTIVFVLLDSLLRAQLPAQILDAISVEHRFTALETKVDAIALSVQDLGRYNWLALLGTAGLCGEAGVRIIKKPKGD